jgi:hypothetical protein
MINTALIQTTLGNVYVVVRDEERPDYCHLYNKDSQVSYVPWCSDWEIIPVDPDSEIVRKAITAIQAEKERILLNRCRKDIDEATRQAGWFGNR